MQQDAAVRTHARHAEPALEDARPLTSHANDEPMPLGRAAGVQLTATGANAESASGSECAASLAEAESAAGAGGRASAGGCPSPTLVQGCAVQHTFRVTVELASGLPAGSAGARARFIRYLFPGARGCLEQPHSCTVC